MIRRFAPLLLILFCFLLDTSILPIVYGGVYTIPLTLVAVFHIGMLMGRMRGLLYGTIGGLLIDITTGTLGAMTFFFMACGFVIGLLLYAPNEHLRASRRIQRRRRTQRVVWVFMLYAIGETALFVIQYFNTTVIEWIFLINIGVRSLLCTLIALLFYPLARRVLLGGNNRRTPARNREVRSY